MAIAAIMLIATVYTTMSAQTTHPGAKPSSSTTAEPRPSDEDVSAARESRNWNGATIVWILLSAVITAWITWIALVKNDKANDLKIARYASQAAKANERAERLESDNLALRGQVATLETNAAEAKKNVAGLQKAAADAKAAQQRVEIELSEQRERTAIAERAIGEAHVRVEELRKQNLEAEARQEKDRATRMLLELSILPRHIGVPRLNRALADFSAVPAEIIFERDSKEAKNAASDLDVALISAGWRTTARPESDHENFVPPGVHIFPGTGDLPQKAAVLLEEFLAANLVEARAIRWFSGVRPPDDAVRIIIGVQQNQYLALRNIVESPLSEWGRQMTEDEQLKALERMLRLRNEWFPAVVHDLPPGVKPPPRRNR